MEVVLNKECRYGMDRMGARVRWLDGRFTRKMDGWEDNRAIRYIEGYDGQ